MHSAFMTSVPLPLPEVLPQLPELFFAQQAMVMALVNCKSLELER